MAGFVAHLDAYGILPIAFAGFSIYTGRINYMQEIERKFLTVIPDISKLMRITQVRESRISQTYLIAPNGGERRVRSRQFPSGITVYFYTEKYPVQESNGLVREEKEREISSEEYEVLLKAADPQFSTISKTRYTFDFNNFTFELDVYTFEENYATLEVEFPSADTRVELPDFIQVIKEVTSDKRYKNKALSKTLAFPE